ncbi:hypothetical protein FX016_06240 [Cupriavidus gilardii]|nr:hypothetical protein FX016_06240 [Cupriavidus gilardii]
MHNVQIHVILAPLLRGAPIIFDYRTPTWRPRQSRATPLRNESRGAGFRAAVTHATRSHHALNAHSTRHATRSRGALHHPSPRIPIALRNAGRR